MVQDHIYKRLEELKAEFEKGHARLKELQDEQTRLNQILLRIGGAIQVLTEVIEDEHDENKQEVE